MTECALTGPLLLRVAGRMVAVGVQGLRPLLAGRVAGLIGMPGLFAVVAELGAAAFSETHQPGTAGTARGNDGEAEETERGGELNNNKSLGLDEPSLRLCKIHFNDVFQQ